MSLFILVLMIDFCDFEQQTSFVKQAFVQRQFARLSKSQPTYVAFVGLITSVGVHVVTQVLVKGETSIANFASVWLVIFPMSYHVSLQTIFGHVALIATFGWTNMQFLMFLLDLG